MQRPEKGHSTAGRSGRAGARLGSASMRHDFASLDVGVDDPVSVHYGISVLSFLFGDSLQAGAVISFWDVKVTAKQ